MKKGNVTMTKTDDTWNYTPSVGISVLITGALGFVGSATTEPIDSETDENVVDYISYDLMDGFDIRDKKQLAHVVEQTKPDRILHLAAIARFSDADNDPLLAYQTNVQGTWNVIEVAKRYHVPVVYASTGSAIMPLDGYTTPYTESIPARGNSVYGCTKAMGEYIVRQHTPHIILRYSHLYGKEKRGHGLIGGFIQRIERGLAPTLYGGEQTNDFCYVKDIAQANLLALSAPWDKWNQVYNIGSGYELTAREAGEAVCKVMGYTGRIEVVKPRTVDPGHFCFDITKAQTMLKFKPAFDFENGLIDMLK